MSIEQVGTEPARSVDADVATIGRIAAVPTILQVVARTTGLRFTAVARVTDHSWTACAVYDLIDFGLKPGGELVLESTICNEIRQHHQPVVFGHASADPLFCDHPTPKMYGFESYISIPIMRSDGTFFGTLCALDPSPSKLDDPNVIKTLQLFTQLISAQLDTEERLEQNQHALLDAEQTSRLREQFIAVLGHDLRNSLQAIGFGTEMLKERASDSRARRIINSIELSCGRMTELIQNILDFARGRLGGGIPLQLELEGHELSDELRHVVAEVQTAHQDAALKLNVQLVQPVRCDRRRIAQLLANLLSNAVSHGATGRPVLIDAYSDERGFELKVSNSGTAIPPDKLARLFRPFSRVPGDALQPGLGLGLYIAAEIAKAHGGTLEVASSDDGTCFTLHIPANHATLFAAPAAVAAAN